MDLLVSAAGRWQVTKSTHCMMFFYVVCSQRQRKENLGFGWVTQAFWLSILIYDSMTFALSARLRASDDALLDGSCSDVGFGFGDRVVPIVWRHYQETSKDFCLLACPFGSSQRMRASRRPIDRSMTNDQTDGFGHFRFGPSCLKIDNGPTCQAVFCVWTGNRLDAHRSATLQLICAGCRN